MSGLAHRRFARPVVWIALTVLVASATWIAVSLPDRARAYPPVRVGYRNQPPFYYVEPSGRPTGVAVEVIRAAARRLGQPVVWTLIDGASDKALLDGRIDIWPTYPSFRTMPNVVVTEAWLESGFLRISKPGTFGDGEGVRGRRVAGTPLPFASDVLADPLDGAVRVDARDSRAAISALCSGEAEAAVVEAREFQDFLLERPPACRDVSLAFGPTPVAITNYGIGATRAAAPVARALRAEILRMAEDGELTRIHSRWAVGTSNETRLVTAFAEARKRERWVIEAGSTVTLALLISLWELRRSRAARRLAEQASKTMADYASRQERYRLLFERNMAGVVRSTFNGRLLDCNLAFARMVGRESREEVLALSAWDLYQSRETREAVLERISREGAATNVELWIKRKDGSRGCLLQSVTLIDEGPGKEATLETTAIDISEIRRLEEHIRQAQKLESVGRLAGGVAHDFNNLLTAINGYAELALAEVTGNTPLRRSLEEIYKAGTRAASLTQQLLAFSRKQILQPVVLNVNDLVREAAGLLARLVEEDISVDVRLGDVGLVRVDQGQFHQVVMNLAVNARDAMMGGGRLTLETANADLQDADLDAEESAVTGAFVRLSVSDTGRGMDPETRRRIFEPFFTTKEIGKGTGLGLSTVYGIVKQSGGHIGVRTAPGQGTTFNVFLPRVDRQANVARTAAPGRRLQAAVTAAGGMDVAD